MRRKRGEKKEEYNRGKIMGEKKVVEERTRESNHGSYLFSLLFLTFFLSSFYINAAVFRVSECVQMYLNPSLFLFCLPRFSVPFFLLLFFSKSRNHNERPGMEKTSTADDHFSFLLLVPSSHYFLCSCTVPSALLLPQFPFCYSCFPCYLFIFNCIILWLYLFLVSTSFFFFSISQYQHVLLTRSVIIFYFLSCSLYPALSTFLCT